MHTCNSWLRTQLHVHMDKKIKSAFSRRNLPGETKVLWCPTLMMDTRFLVYMMFELTEERVRLTVLWLYRNQNLLTEVLGGWINCLPRNGLNTQLPLKPQTAVQTISTAQICRFYVDLLSSFLSACCGFAHSSNHSVMATPHGRGCEYVHMNCCRQWATWLQRRWQTEWCRHL